MVWSLDCDCAERIGVEINSMKLFYALKEFFNKQAEKGIFIEETPNSPFYVGKGCDGVSEWYATKWYRCTQCGCLWEFDYPDFPAKGFVRKFEDGIYKKAEYSILLCLQNKRRFYEIC